MEFRGKDKIGNIGFGENCIELVLKVMRVNELLWEREREDREKIRFSIRLGVV